MMRLVRNFPIKLCFNFVIDHNVKKSNFSSYVLVQTFFLNKIWFTEWGKVRVSHVKKLTGSF